MALMRTKGRKVLLVSVLIVSGWLAKYLSESEMRRLDKEVDRLCAVDGGVMIYETVRLPAESFHKEGKPLLPYGRDDTGFGYFMKGFEQLVAGTPDHLQGASLKRWEMRVIRASDGKLIARSVWYNRSGGDWLRQFFMVGRGKECANADEFNSFTKQVFLQE